MKLPRRACVGGACLTGLELPIWGIAARRMPHRSHDQYMWRAPSAEGVGVEARNTIRTAAIVAQKLKV